MLLFFRFHSEVNFTLYFTFLMFSFSDDLVIFVHFHAIRLSLENIALLQHNSEFFSHWSRSRYFFFDWMTDENNIFYQAIKYVLCAQDTICTCLLFARSLVPLLVFININNSIPFEFFLKRSFSLPSCAFKMTRVIKMSASSPCIKQFHFQTLLDTTLP